jgi:hypothetical protein
MTHHGRNLVVALVVAVLALASQSAEAQVKPFKISGGGIAADGFPTTLHTPAPHNAVGNATELGKYSAEGFFELDAFTGPLDADFSSSQPCVFIAANRDRIEFDYAGTVELSTEDGVTFTAVFTATFTPVLTPGANTGRFKKVIGGSFVMVATTAPFMFGELDVPYTWSGEGTLKFGK